MKICFRYPITTGKVSGWSIQDKIMMPLELVNVPNCTTMVDETNMTPQVIVPERDNDKFIASNPKHDLEERLEAYEDIIDSGMGDTTMTRARNIEREFGFRQLFLKFDGGNATGTQKDGIAFAQAMDAMRRGFDTITMATCCNYGVALSLAASLAGIKVCYLYTGTFQTKRSQGMTDFGAEITRLREITNMR